MAQVIEEARKRITARVSDKVRVTLEQAAELLGATVNQFVAVTAYQEAQRVIERESVIPSECSASSKGRAQGAVLLPCSTADKPNQRLKEAVKLAFKRLPGRV